MNPIQTTAELRAYILQLVQDNKDTQRTLEEYLLALLLRIQTRKDTQPSYQDFADFLRDSYTSELADFSDEWRNLSWVTTEINSEAYHEEIRTFACQERRLKLKIYGLHDLSARGVLHKDPKKLWLNGADDFSGARWYNFEVNSFVERGTTWLESYEPEEEEYSKSDGWVDFGSIVVDGASYE